MKKCISDCFCLTENHEATHTWTLTTHDPSKSPVEDLAACLAEKIVEQRCICAPQYYEAWQKKFYENVAVAPNSRKALLAFLKPVFGEPNASKSIPAAHLEGYVGEMLWFFLCKENSTEAIVHIDPPSFTVTEQGGDGFIIHRIKSQDLFFRLWEMKKFVPGPNNSTAKISQTIGNAYSQLNARSLDYLARYTMIGQHFLGNPEIVAFCGQLAELWINASPQAAVGVSVVTSAAHVPQTAFSTFGKQFPDFTVPVRLRGMITATEDFAEFANKVREYIWKGL